MCVISCLGICWLLCVYQLRCKRGFYTGVCVCYWDNTVRDTICTCVGVCVVCFSFLIKSPLSHCVTSVEFPGYDRLRSAVGWVSGIKPEQQQKKKEAQWSKVQLISKNFDRIMDAECKVQMDASVATEDRKHTTQGCRPSSTLTTALLMFTLCLAAAAAALLIFNSDTKVRIKAICERLKCLSQPVVWLTCSWPFSNVSLYSSLLDTEPARRQRQSWWVLYLWFSLKLSTYSMH